MVKFWRSTKEVEIYLGLGLPLITVDNVLEISGGE